MRVSTLTVSMLALTAIFAVGCAPSTDTDPPQAGKTTVTHDETGELASTEDGEHDHSGWWCGEHGIPEEVCSMCSAKAAADFQRQGDWCAEHDRAKSQCFECDPSLKEKFAAQYRAKFGEEPPAIAD